MSGLLFFSGGTALRELSRELAARGLPSTHIITTFDSGGSSRELRKAFNMPAIGDLRNRLLALAAPEDRSGRLRQLLNRRLNANPRIAWRELEGLIRPETFKMLPAETGVIIRKDFETFFENLSPDFNPAIASIGNMVLTGAYLSNGRRLYQAVKTYGRLLNIVGEVIPVYEGCRQLKAFLASGRTLTGQHLFKNVREAIQRIELVDEGGNEERVVALPEAIDAISRAKVICFPMGSFFSSLIANLLPYGIGRTIAESAALKIFIPNSGADPELGTLTIWEQINIIHSYIQATTGDAHPGTYLNMLIIDEQNGVYNGDLKKIELLARKTGIGIRKSAFMRDGSHHDPAKLADLLLDILRNE